MHPSTSHVEEYNLAPDTELTASTARFRHARSDLLVNSCLILGTFTLSWGLARFGAWNYASLGGLNLTLSDTFFLFAIALLMTRGRLNSRPFGPATALWYIGFLLFIGGLFVSSIVHGMAIRWASISVQYLFALVAIPIMFASFRREVLEHCLIAFALGVATSQAIALVASGFLDYYNTWEIMGTDFITVRGRIGALSGNANINGAMAAFGLLMVLYALHRRLLARWALLSCGGFLVWGIVASASFTAFSLAALAVPLFSFIVWPRRTLVIGLPLLIIVLGFLGSGLPLPAAFEERVAEAFASGDIGSAGTFIGRWEIAMEAWRLCGRTLFVGFGADGYRLVSSMNAPVHVFPLLILTEGGLVSLTGLVILSVMLWTLGFAMLRQDRASAALILSLLLVFSGFTLAVPHMYARMWIAPMMLAIIHGLTSYFGQGPYQARFLDDNSSELSNARVTSPRGAGAKPL